MTRIRLATLAMLALAIPLGLWGLYRLARSPRVQVLGTLVARVETSEKVVALSFDDGPAMESLDEVLARRDEADVRATFFVTGRELAAAPEAGRRLVQAGHELGNHSYSHRRMILTSPSFVRSEIERTDSLIRAAGQGGKILFRPPYGKKLFVLPWYLWRNGRTAVSWDVDANSTATQGVTAEHIAQRVVQRVRPGSIVLFHPWYRGRAASRAAVQIVVTELRRRGCTFVTVGELLSR